MELKNIDKTIQSLLFCYAKWCSVVLAKMQENIQKNKFRTDEARKKAIAEYRGAVSAYDFLKQIADNPKKYLYSGNDIIHTDLPDGITVYHKLLPILVAPFDRGGNHVLVKLSEAIAHHVRCCAYEDFCGIWTYNEKKFDLGAREIIELHKIVQLWNTNNFVAVFRSFVPGYAFAMDLYKKKAR